MIYDWRYLIIKEFAGLISKEDLVHLADNKIKELDEPPYYLIKISADESLKGTPYLDLVAEPVSESELIQLSAELICLLRSDKVSLEEMGGFISNLCQVIDRYNELYSDFSWISEEVYLVLKGYKDRAKSKAQIEEVLNSISRLK